MEIFNQFIEAFAVIFGAVLGLGCAVLVVIGVLFVLDKIFCEED